VDTPCEATIESQVQLPAQSHMKNVPQQPHIADATESVALWHHSPPEASVGRNFAVEIIICGKPLKACIKHSGLLSKSPTMDAALEKIRPHTSSKLLHQKKPADLLVALESTFDEQKTERSPTAYFAALLTTLEGTVQKQDLGLEDGDVLPAELYLLALVSPFVPPPVIRSHLSTVLAIAGPLFSALMTHAPPLRSQITLFESVILALERSQLEAHGIRQIFASILQLSLDSRPKVRRKAAEVIRSILNSPPPPLMYHPYAKIVAEWAIEALEINNTGVIPRAKGKKADASFSDTFIHLLSCIRPILSKFPAEVS
jgi:ribosomal RNA-processing protein 12